MRQVGAGEARDEETHFNTPNGGKGQDKAIEAIKAIKSPDMTLASMGPAYFVLAIRNGEP